MISSFKHQINYYYFPPDSIFKDYIAKKGNRGSLFYLSYEMWMSPKERSPKERSPKETSPEFIPAGDTNFILCALFFILYTFLRTSFLRTF